MATFSLCRGTWTVLLTGLIMVVIGNEAMGQAARPTNRLGVVGYFRPVGQSGVGFTNSVFGAGPGFSRSSDIATSGSVLDNGLTSPGRRGRGSGISAGQGSMFSDSSDQPALLLAPNRLRSIHTANSNRSFTVNQNYLRRVDGSGLYNQSSNFSLGAGLGGASPHTGRLGEPISALDKALAGMDRLKYQRMARNELLGSSSAMLDSAGPAVSAGARGGATLPPGSAGASLGAGGKTLPDGNPIPQKTLAQCFDERLEGKYRGYVSDAVAAFQAGDFDRAKARLDSAEVVHPKHPATQTGILLTTVSDGEYYQAASYLTALLDRGINPLQLKPYVEQWYGSPEKAREHINKLRTRTDLGRVGTTPRAVLACLLWYIGESGAALAEADAVKSNVDRHSPLSKLADFMHQADSKDPAATTSAR